MQRQFAFDHIQGAVARQMEAAALLSKKPYRSLPVVCRAVILKRMSDVTQILSAIERGDPKAAEQLLPLVYDELRKLAAQRMAGERADHTLQPTALVHEAYLRLQSQS